MVTDSERVLQDLKVFLQSKDSHGRRELLQTIGELEARHTLSEGLPERALRLHGAILSEELKAHGSDTRPATEAAAGGNGNGHS